ncbi:WG repeat-containing protein [Rufibacter roseus]|uniref:WG repeat-containing protein n=1 Tax=Rufibacter roseus TaxID=1567108 RepID=A0ABW2DL61_9BACT|nr:WG repeat-containing protein [Rufibacter roseus]
MSSIKTFSVITYLIVAIFFCSSCKREPFKGNLFAIKQGGKWGYIDSVGNLILEPQFLNAGDFNEGLAKVEVESGINYIDKGGNVVIRIEEGFVDFQKFPNFKEGSIVLKSNDKYKIYDREGNSQLVNTNIDNIYSMSGGLMRFSIGENYGFIKAGQTSYYLNPTYQEAQDFTDGVAIVGSNGKFGGINKNGDYLFPPKFTWCHEFSEGLALAYDGHEVGFIGKKGKFEIIENDKFEFRATGSNSYFGSSFSEGLAMVSFTRRVNCREEVGFGSSRMAARGIKPIASIVCDEDTKLGFINKRGEIVVPIIYYGLGQFSEGLAAFKRGNKWGYLDKDNNIIIKPQFDKAEKFKNGLARIGLLGSENSYKYGYVNASGRYIWQPSN